MGGLKQKLFKNFYDCWKNSVRKIYNMAVNRFGKGYAVQQHLLRWKMTIGIEKGHF